MSEERRSNGAKSKERWSDGETDEQSDRAKSDGAKSDGATEQQSNGATERRSK